VHPLGHRETHDHIKLLLRRHRGGCVVARKIVGTKLDARLRLKLGAQAIEPRRQLRRINSAHILLKVIWKKRKYIRSVRPCARHGDKLVRSVDTVVRESQLSLFNQRWLPKQKGKYKQF
jgi:hypothetical protein